MSGRRALLALPLIVSLAGCTLELAPALPAGRPTPPSAAMPAPPAPAQGGAAVAASAGPIELPPPSFEFEHNPDIVKRVSEAPHAYFRFIAHDFARATCKLLGKAIERAPRVVLHGDPHVEQYAVTDLGRGIGDYDDAAVGPQVIDLVRMATSARLAARERGWSEAEEPLVAELYRGYRDGLDAVAPPAKPPRAVEKLLAKFTTDKRGFLEFVDKSMVPIDPDELRGHPSAERGEAFVRAQLASYVQQVKGKTPDRPAGFFEVKKLGATKLGIGSALTRKYLLHVEGPGPSADDDVIIEIKQVPDLRSIPCVTQLTGGAAEQRSVEQERAGKAASLLAPVLLPGRQFWVNEWLPNYHEIKIKKLDSKEDLAEIVYELGIALAREHQKPVPGGPAPDARALALGAPLQAEVSKASAELARATIRGWEQFRREVAREGQQGSLGTARSAPP